MAGPVWLIWRLLPCYQDDLGYQVVLCLHCLPDNGRKNPVIEVYWGGGGGGGMEEERGIVIEVESLP